MCRLLRNLYVTRMSFGLAAVLLLCAANSPAQPPLVYTVENTGAGLTPTASLPPWASLPIIRQLPDPFVFFNGTRNTTWAAFEQHRQEWIAALEQYEQGPKPSCTGTSADSVLGVPYVCSVTASYVTTSANHFTLTVVITVTGGPNGTQTLSLSAAIVTPTASAAFTPPTQSAVGTCGPVPANGWPWVMGMGGATGSWPATAFTATTRSPAGVSVPPSGCAATVVYNLNTVARYTGGGNAGSASGVHTTDGFYQLYPNLCAGTCTSAQGFPNGQNSGEYAAWSWGVSRLIDGIQMVSAPAYAGTGGPLPLDTAHSAVTGCSYAGKMAMFGGAWDERIALTIAQENGGGGAPSWRVSHAIETQGSVEDINDTSYEWFSTNMLNFSGYNAYKEPIDHSQLMAMTAPRALLQTGDSEYYWLGDRSATYDSLATEKIYANYGIGDRFGYYIDTTHTHCAVPAYQQNATQPTINRFLFGTNNTPIPQVSWLLADALQPGAQPTINPDRWTAWWGTGKPAFAAADVWNHGGNLELPLNQSLTINTGDIISTQYQVRMPGGHPAGTVTVPTAFTEVDVSCSDGTSYTFAVPPPLAPTPSANGFYYSGSKSAASNPQTFSIGPNDTAAYPSSVFSAPNPGCGNGAPGTVTGTYFYGLGVTNPGAGNPGLPGFQTTIGVQGSGQTDPLAVTFTLSDSTTGQGGAWAPWTTLDRLNPYSCDPWGCPLTPTITWPAPTTISAGTALSATQLNATASSALINGMASATTAACGASTPADQCTGLLVTTPVAGTFTYDPPAGTVMNTPGTYNLSVTFTPGAIATDTGTTSATVTNSTVYKTYTIATATVPVTVLASPTVSLTTTSSVSGSNAAGYTLKITITNTGSAPATNVTLTAATLGSATASPLPQTGGTIAAGGTFTFTVAVPGGAGPDGAGVAERVSGTYTGGTFSGNIRSVTLP